MSAGACRSGFRLVEGVELVSVPPAGIVLMRDPLRVFKVNAAAFAVLKRCQHGVFFGGATDDRSTLQFLEKMEEAGVLVWEPQRTGPDASVSIVVPVFNRDLELAACLESLKDLDYPKDKLEIIVVDDGSDDDSSRIAQSAGVKVVRLPENKGQSAARNIGVNHASGEIIAFIDSDCVATTSWLKELVPYLVDGRYVLVGGYVDSFYRQTSLERYEKVCSPLNMGNKRVEGRGLQSVLYVPTCNMLVARGAFIRVGGFDERLRLGEDVDLCWRLLKHGNRLLYLPRGTVAHRHRTNLIQAMVQRFHYGTSESILYDWHRHVGKRFPLQPSRLLLLAMVIGCLLTMSTVLLAAALLLVELECCCKVRQVRKKMDIAVSRWEIRKASYKNSFALVYHFLHHLLRYYLLVLVVLAALFAPVINLLAAVLVVPAAASYAVKKPQMAFAWFWIYFVLDQASYQCGALWGCIRNRCFRLYWISLGEKRKAETRQFYASKKGQC